ncbi:hypothetical protein CHS0354_004608 [Potamilus streckersoni]|uniref:Uncharacterized protein n=1 Tax=Potamilus streckersoni TaxID=2493646 RepID=A0AAE0S5J2_9BIVA|nr:hypothetical protein CHS0354_004608 [Potamilus streckersoni]
MVTKQEHGLNVKKTKLLNDIKKATRQTTSTIERLQEQTDRFQKGLDETRRAIVESKKMLLLSQKASWQYVKWLEWHLQIFHHHTTRAIQNWIKIMLKIAAKDND